MLDDWRGDGKEVAVLGLGRSGVAATRLLLREGIQVYGSESADTPELEAKAKALRSGGASVELGRHDLERIRRAVAVVVSPGIPPDAAPVAAARDARVPVHSEIDVGWAGATINRAHHAPKYIAITGTNGKTTTTALTAHLLEAAGFRATAAGNIGKPLSEAALEGVSYEWLAVEVSSFQLHDTHWFTPAIGVLTNLAPDHLDRYASLEDYYADKARLFQHTTAESVWVTNADDPAVERMAGSIPGKRRRFSVRSSADGWYDRPSGRLILGREVLLQRSQLQLLGDHNVANALAAALAVQDAGGTLLLLAGGLRSFQALPHRLEPVREVGGVLWINDSKATNVASTTVALEALERPYVLLLGGRHKGEPYTHLADHMRGHCKAVVVYGEAGDIVEHDLKDKIKVVRATTFKDVLAMANSLTQSGDAVLLSPACSSYDMFRNFEDRGAQFRAAVEAM